MKLRNNQTGEIVVFGEGVIDLNQIGCKNVAEMIEAGWEDYKEPVKRWHIDADFGICSVYEEDLPREGETDYKESIGNDFATREEAEQAVEKLKALKRLKDRGFKIDLWDYVGGNYQEKIQTGRILFRVEDNEENDKDIDLLFGREKLGKE